MDDKLQCGVPILSNSNLVASYNVTISNQQEHVAYSLKKSKHNSPKLSNCDIAFQQSQHQATDLEVAWKQHHNLHIRDHYASAKTYRPNTINNAVLLQSDCWDLKYVDVDGNYGQHFLQFNSEIGTGGFGVVYQAKHVYHDAFMTCMQPDLAVKIVKNDALARDEVRFHQFASTLENVSCVIPVLATCFTEHVVVMVMPLAYGTAMDIVMEMSPTTIIQYWMNIARVVQEMHEKSVYHRDIKPANLLFFRKDENDAGVLKLADFGLAAHASQLPTPTGTVSFYPPEAFGDEQCVFDPNGCPIHFLPFGYDGLAHDVWSLALTLFRLLLNDPEVLMMNGESPWNVAHATDPFYQYYLTLDVEERERFFSTYLIMPCFSSFFTKALHPNQNERYQTVAEMIKAMTAMLAEHCSNSCFCDGVYS